MTELLTLPDLSGLSRLDGATALVTGGSGGIGLSTAVGLSQLGAAVIITGRDPGRGDHAVRRISGTTHNPQVWFHAADLSTLDGVHQLARQLLEEERPLQLLVNNAGALPPAGTRNTDGVDLALAVNHWAPFLLTSQLLPLIRPAGTSSTDPGSGPGARIVNVTSGAIHLTRFRLDAIEPRSEADPHQGRSAFAAYAQSKCAALVATVEWAKRLAAAHGPVVHAADPGGADTALTRGMGSSNAVASRLLAAFGPGRRSAVVAARSTLVAAAEANLGLMTGRFVTAGGRNRPIPRRFRNQQLRHDVWSLTCDLVGVDPSMAAWTTSPDTEGPRP